MIDRILGSYLKPPSNNQHMTISTPSDLLTGTNRLQGEIQELDQSPQHQDKSVGELACEIQQLSTVVHDTHNLMYDTRNLMYSTHKLVKNDVLRDLILNSSQRQVPRIVLFTKQDASFKQKLITELVPGMKALQLHLLCEYKGREHIVEGQAGCQVILQDENWKKVHELVKEGLKWVFLAAKVGAHIAMGLGNMVPNPKMEYGKAVVAFGEVGARGEGDYRKQKKSEAKVREDAELEAVNKRKRAELVAANKKQAEFEAANRKQAEDEAHIRKQVELEAANRKNLTLGSKLNWRWNGGSRLRMKLQIGEDRLRRRRLRARKGLRKKQLILTRSKRLS
ncbi:unnamed protein product [Sphagnum troendelagicum]